LKCKNNGDKMMNKILAIVACALVVLGAVGSAYAQEVEEEQQLPVCNPEGGIFLGICRFFTYNLPMWWYSITNNTESKMDLMHKLVVEIQLEQQYVINKYQEGKMTQERFGKLISDLMKEYKEEIKSLVEEVKKMEKEIPQKAQEIKEEIKETIEEYKETIEKQRQEGMLPEIKTEVTVEIHKTMEEMEKAIEEMRTIEKIVTITKTR